jgi:cyclopropane fatty-acyl-phospholipid synthase-like methyltransferase
MVRTLLAEMHLRPGESIVEVGCGSGVVTRGLAHSTGAPTAL